MLGTEIFILRDAPDFIWAAAELKKTPTTIPK